MTTHLPEPCSPALRRTRDGVDIACYERRARRLRAQYIHASISALMEMLARLWRGVLRRAARRRAWQELRALDTQARQDLALDLSDLDALATGEFFVDTTRRQRATSTAQIRSAENTRHAFGIAAHGRKD